MCEGLFDGQEVISKVLRISGLVGAALLLSGGCESGDPACGTARTCGNTLAHPV